MADKDGRLVEFAAVVFTQSKAKPNKIRALLEEYAKTLLWHDCRVFVVVEPNFRMIVTNFLQSENLPSFGLSNDEENASLENMRILTPLVHVLDGVDKWTALERFLRYFPSRNILNHGLEIQGIDQSTDERGASQEIQILVRRAFHDCAKVEFHKTASGLSESDTYRVYAYLKDDLVGRDAPYEYFVKIGKRELLSREYLKFRSVALEHIPFHLGPKLRPDRCALGTRHGIIVSDYVSQSESLRDCARKGRAVPIIANLFNATLRPWQDNCRKDQKPLQDYLSERMPDTIPEERMKMIKNLSPTYELDVLKEIICEKPSKPVKIGTVHGDLHALNILVRGTDAILIDFEKVIENFPLLLDFASLEAGLVVNGLVDDGRELIKILSSIRALYGKASVLDYQLRKCPPGDELVWFFDCIWQIRLRVAQFELKKGQYALTLATELLKKAGKDGNLDDTEKMRAIAYVLADEILKEQVI